MQTPTIGQFHQGGFFAGVINLNGEPYGVVVAPKEAGESPQLPWGEYGATAASTDSLVDGAANTQGMAEAGSKLAQWAQKLDINGFADWYIPSREELELMYRHMKPTTDENWASFRDGENIGSVPVGFPYSKTAPTQTQIAAFQAGNAEAFKPAFYWSSTQYSAYFAWDQYFYDGNQFYNHEGFQARARAVRRFKLAI